MILQTSAINMWPHQTVPSWATHPLRPAMSIIWGTQSGISRQPIVGQKSINGKNYSRLLLSVAREPSTRYIKYM